MEKGSEASSKLPSIIYMLLCLQVRKHVLFQKIIMQWRSSNQDRTNDILKNTRKLHEQPVSQTDMSINSAEQDTNTIFQKSMGSMQREI